MPVQVGLVLYLVQTGLYLLGVCLLSKQIAVHFSTAIANVCCYALLANFFVYPYLAISLTDGFSVILLLFICYVILKIFSDPFPLSLNRKSALLRIALGFLVGFAIMVRPANISWLLLLLPVAVAWSIQCRDGWRFPGGANSRHLHRLCFGCDAANTIELGCVWSTYFLANAGFRRGSNSVGDYLY